VLVEMEKWRGNVKYHLVPQNPVTWLSEAVRPRMEKWDSGGATLGGSSFKILHASQQLDAFMTKRSTKHSMPGKENGIKIARAKRASTRVIKKV
jgi:hypothetical protein